MNKKEFFQCRHCGYRYSMADINEMSGQMDDLPRYKIIKKKLIRAGINENGIGNFINEAIAEKLTNDANNKKEDNGVNAEKFREIIHKKYKECMEDCQLPTGALAILNPAEFFAFYQLEESKRLRHDVIRLSIAINEIFKVLPTVTRMSDICQECSDITKAHLPYNGIQD